MQRLLIIDGHAILYRAYHALPPLTTTSGEKVGAVYGFISMLLRTLADLKPTHLAVAFDRPEPTFRNKLFADYQVQRPKMEEDLVGQVDSMHEILKKMRIPFYEISGFEADDVIGTLARQARKCDVVIVSGDRDLLQLVSKSVKIYMPIKGLSVSKLFGEKEVMEKFGIKPGEIADFKALIGDPSDNYPGVAGIGPKTAAELIGQFGTIENIYKNLNKTSGKIREKLIAGEENAFLSKKLATIVTDVPVELDLTSSKIDTLDRPDIRSLFEELEFRSLIPRLALDRKETVSDKTRGSKKNMARQEKDKISSEQTSLF